MQRSMQVVVQHQKCNQLPLFPIAGERMDRREEESCARVLRQIILLPTQSTHLAHSAIAWPGVRLHFVKRTGLPRQSVCHGQRQGARVEELVVLDFCLFQVQLKDPVHALSQSKCDCFWFSPTRTASTVFLTRSKPNSSAFS